MTMTVGDIMREVRAKAVAEARAMRGPAPDVGATPSVSTSVTMAVTCPECGSGLVGVTDSGTGKRHRRVAVGSCPVCDVSYRLRVSLEAMGHRWPIGPLRAMEGDVSDSELAQRLQCDRSMIRLWSRDGLPDHDADRLACGRGLHPSLIWPDW